MAMLIAVTTSEGTRRCDARCYNGKRSKCRCVCGGMNHGVGRQQAEKNICDMTQDLVDRYGVAADIPVSPRKEVMIDA